MAFTAFSANAKAVEQAPKKRGWIALLLLAPGIAYMLLFFVAPFIQLAITSLQAPAASGGIGQYVAAAQFSNYWVALLEYWPHLLRSFAYSLSVGVSKANTSAGQSSSNGPMSSLTNL